MSRKDLREPLLEKRGGGGGEATTVTTCPPIKKAKGEDAKLLEALFAHLAAKTAEGDAEAMKLISAHNNLLNSSAEITLSDGRSKAYVTPLYVAVSKGRGEIVTQILRINESLVHQESSKGLTPLHIAAHNGHRETCELLLTKGANVNATSKDGVTPLYIAAQNGHRETCELLLARRADVNAANKNGFTPLHIAAQNGHRETCKLLLAFGADPKASTSLAYLRRTPSAVAKLHNHQDIVNNFKHHASLSLEAREAIYGEIKEGVFSRLGEREKGEAVTKPRDAVAGAGAAAVGHSDERGRI